MRSRRARVAGLVPGLLLFGVMLVFSVRAGNPVLTLVLGPVVIVHLVLIHRIVSDRRLGELNLGRYRRLALRATGWALALLAYGAVVAVVALATGQARLVPLAGFFVFPALFLGGVALRVSQDIRRGEIPGKVRERWEEARRRRGE